MRYSANHLVLHIRQKNVRDHLIRANVPGDLRPYPERAIRSMKKCGNDCNTACPFIE
jgi:hypothetical protein